MAAEPSIEQGSAVEDEDRITTIITVVSLEFVE
jgi:hypothetical protein